MSRRKESLNETLRSSCSHRTEQTLEFLKQADGKHHHLSRDEIDKLNSMRQTSINYLKEKIGRSLQLFENNEIPQKVFSAKERVQKFFSSVDTPADNTSDDSDFSNESFGKTENHQNWFDHTKRKLLYKMMGSRL